MARKSPEYTEENRMILRANAAKASEERAKQRATDGFAAARAGIYQTPLWIKQVRAGNRTLADVYTGEHGVRWSVIGRLRLMPNDNILKHYAWAASVAAVRKIYDQIKSDDAVSPSGLTFLKEVLDGKIKAPPPIDGATYEVKDEQPAVDQSVIDEARNQRNKEIESGGVESA